MLCLQGTGKAQPMCGVQQNNKVSLGEGPHLEKSLNRAFQLLTALISLMFVIPTSLYRGSDPGPTPPGKRGLIMSQAKQTLEEAPDSSHRTGVPPPVRVGCLHRPSF